ncbi:MAG TPA: FAD-dependent oxidoreductase [Pyrinomonadaceae bacterium]
MSEQPPVMIGQGIDRRRFLRSAIGASAFALGQGYLNPLNALAASLKPERRFAPVKVSKERIIRTVVGLRPYRAEGFVVKVERLGKKIVIHNYGHGGAGMSLSWGTSTMAAEHARETGRRRFAVLGCGVMGLSTARLLQRRGGAVTIYTKEMPPETTSNIAGALWLPTSSYNPQSVTPEFQNQFRLAARISNREFQNLVGDNYGVRWIESFMLQRETTEDVRELIGGAQLYPETQVHRDSQAYFGFPQVTQFSTMLIEPATYLSALLRDFFVAGGKVLVKTFRSREEILALPEQVILNCTGLGARALFKDEALIPVRGQLEVLLPQPEIDYCYLYSSLYMFPRRDGIILGGSFDRDNWSLAPDAEESKYILDGHTDIMKGLRH